jgi:hypothetical protein
MAFLSTGLEKLVQNLYEGGKGIGKFVHSSRHCHRPKHLDLLKKGVYPYDYMSRWERFDESQLPPKEAFYSKLMGDDISEESYQHGQAVWFSAQPCMFLTCNHEEFTLRHILCVCYTITRDLG